MERKTKDYSIRGKLTSINEGVSTPKRDVIPQKPNITPPPKPPKDRNPKK